MCALPGDLSKLGLGNRRLGLRPSRLLRRTHPRLRTVNLLAAGGLLRLRVWSGDRLAVRIFLDSTITRV